MRIERTARARLSAGLAALAFAIAASTAAGQEGSGRPSLLLVDAQTTVSSVGFRFLDGSALPEARLAGNIATRGPGALAGLKGALDFLPGVSAPERPDFSPLSLQKDVVRLRRLYARAGFPDADVDYDVSLDTTRNAVDVTFVVAQGTPLRVGSVEVRLEGGADAGSASPADSSLLPAELRPAWDAYAERLRASRGRRFSDEERGRLVSETSDWLLHRGYPWTRVRIDRADTVGDDVTVGLAIAPGVRARVDTVVVQGARSLSDATIRREIPIHTGDWFDAGKLSEGERELYDLELVRRALGDVQPGQPHDSTVTLRMRVEEGLPHLVWGRVGWRSEAGVATEAHWTHRNFFGGARTFTASATVESGWGALEQASTRSVGVSATARQPYLWDRHLSGSVGPFARLRDDFRDRSLLYGIETAVIFRLRPLKTLTLQHELSRLRVDDALQLLPIRQIVQNGEAAYSPFFTKSVFTLSGSYGTLDDRLDPRSGFLLQPSVEVTGPAKASDIEFFRLAAAAVAAIPLTARTGLFLRGSAGRLFPFGASDPTDAASRTRAFVGLREVMFTAGGTSDVRGWGAGMLGPKIPDVSVNGDGVVIADRYLPVGGLARLTGSVELSLPFPFLPAPHGTFVFLDAGRVWSPGRAFEPGDPDLAKAPWGFSTGAGLKFGTPVGPLRLSVGYKLDPTRVDLLDPADVARALASGEGLSALPEHGLRRWHLHLSIGRPL